jgi:uncharacterized protein YegP (UPF0339 family)
MHFELYRRLTLRGRQWFWRLRAQNGRIIAQGEGYHNRADAAHAIELVKGTGSFTPIQETP